MTVMATKITVNDLKRVIGRTQGFPTLPIVVTQVLKVINDPNSSATDVARIIQQDQALTSSLLRLVNSAAYGLGRKVISVPDAISVLGFSTVMSLTVGAAVMDAFLIQVFDMKHFWKHTIATSIAARHFAERLGNREKTELAGILGLIHDIGKLAFMTEMPRQYGAVVRQARMTADISIYVERDLLGVDHCQAGQILAQRWGWPKIYQDVIVSHHSPYLSQIDPKLNFCIFLGNLAAHVVLDKEYQGASFTQIMQLVKTQKELANLVRQPDWEVSLQKIVSSQDEIKSFVEVMV